MDDLKEGISQKIVESEAKNFMGLCGNVACNKDSALLENEFGPRIRANECRLEGSFGPSLARVQSDSQPMDRRAYVYGHRRVCE
jgi:hypothetical protein